MTSLVFLAGFGLLVVALALFAAFRFEFGLGLVLFCALHGVVAPDMPLFTLAGILVYSADVVSGVLLLASLPRLLSLGHLSTAELCWLTFGLIVFLGFVVGAMEFGLKRSGVEARVEFYLFAAALYASATFRPSHSAALGALWQIMAACLMLVAVGRWTGVIPTPQGIRAQLYMVSRVLPAAAGLVICQAFILMLFRLRRRPSLGAICWTIPLGIAVVALQQRSVWLSGLAALNFVARGSGKFLRMALAIALVGIIGWTVWAGMRLESSRLGQSVSFALKEPAARESTAVWRTELWWQYVKVMQPGEPVQAFLGYPFGRKLTSLPYSPHNAYVQAFAIHGIVGFLCYVAAWFAVLRGLHRRSLSSQAQAEFFYALSVTVLMTLVFSVAYWPSPEQGILLGVGMALSRRTVRKQISPVPSPVRARERVWVYGHPPTAGL